MIASPNDLSYFVELADTLNFSRASERIGISQPSLTAAIKRLEFAIGTELFFRSKNGVTLSHAGKRLLSHTKQLLQLWNNVKSETLASHFEIQGSFSLGCHSSVALYSLSRFLPKLLHQYPTLEIQLIHDLSRRILEGIINLRIDLGIIVNPIKHPDLIMQKLYDDQVTFWQTTTPEHIVDPLNESTALICDTDLIQTQWLLKRLHKTGLNYRRITRSSSLEVIANLTAHGAGIGILPTSIALSAYPEKLKPIPNMPFYSDEIFLVYRHENRHIKTVQIIISAIKSHFNR